MGVWGTEEVAVVGARAMRELSGVGAPICDFCGVASGFVREPVIADVEELGVKRPREEVGAGLAILGRRPAVMKGWRSAGRGLSLRSGSQIKHLAITVATIRIHTVKSTDDVQSTNSSSSQRRTWARVLEPGRRLRPLELTTGRGWPLLSEPRNQYRVHFILQHTYQRIDVSSSFG